MFLAGWFVVAGMAALLWLALTQALKHPAFRLHLSAVALFLLFEIALTSYVLSRANTPDWFEAFFLFNGYAIPAQALAVLGVQFHARWRARWACIGGLLAATFPVVCVIALYVPGS